MAHRMSDLRSCPACESADAKPLPDYSPSSWQVAECAACGFVYLRNPPGYSALVQDFAWEKTSADLNEVRQKRSPKLRSASRSVMKWTKKFRQDHNERFARMFGAGKVLDIGCGRGHRLKAPIIPFGIELSQNLYEQADANMRALGGYCLHAPGAEGIWQFDENFFDGILMHSYLEHEEAVLPALLGAHRALKPAGKIFVRVPNFASLNRRFIGPNWCGFRYPDHVNYFTLPSLRRVAAKAGFDTKLVNRFNLMINDNIHALLTKAGTVS